MVWGAKSLLLLNEFCALWEFEPKDVMNNGVKNTVLVIAL